MLHPGMLEVFMDKAAGMNLENVRCLNLDLGDGDALPGEYDLILSRAFSIPIIRVFIISVSTAKR